MIFTFYSYKGGVGRSMALATVARMLAGRGLRVLTVDFDLEAPGLEHYFYERARTREPRAHPGLLDLIKAYRQALSDEAAFARAEFKQLSRYTLVARGNVGAQGGYVHLMTAGQREPASKEREYAFAVRAFDWQDFYFNWKGDRFFEWLRRQWADRDNGYDVVFVDSRTGVTEMGGVCAYQLADAAVLLCAPNYQNLRGTKAVAEDFLSESVTALRHGRPLQILTVPARVEFEHPLRDRFFDDFDREMGAIGLPPRLASAGVRYRDLALPYLAEFAIAELQVGDYLADKELLKPAYKPFERLADALTLLANPPHPLTRYRDDALLRLSGGSAAAFTPLEADTSRSSAGYDAFLDFGEADREFCEELRRRCLAAGVSVFIDSRQTSAGTTWSEELERALDYSATLLVAFGKSTSSIHREELLKRARQRRRLQIVPTLLPDGDPSVLRSFGLDEVQHVDCRQGLTDASFANLLAVLRRPSTASDEAQPAPSLRGPYPGGEPYTEDDAGSFFGREEETQAVIHALRHHHVVLLEGPAKVGKTSLLAAGVIPALRKLSLEHDGWAVDRIVRGASSLDLTEFPAWLERRASKPGDQSRLDVVVFDGLDTFTLPIKNDVARRDKALALVANAAANLRVILVWRGTLADDDYESTLEAWKTAPFVHLYLQPLRGEALRRAIEQPARSAAHLLENGLTERLVEGAGSALNSSYQIQLALAQLWNSRARGWLTNQALDALGHVQGVFQKHLEHVLANTAVFSRHDVEVLFTALTEVSSADIPIAKRSTWREVSSIAGLSDGGLIVRDSLAAAGVLDLWRRRKATADMAAGVYVAFARPEVSRHFDAISASPDLGFIRWRHALGSQITLWQAQNGSTEALLLDAALFEAEAWLQRRRDWLMEHERAFIEASLEARASRVSDLRVTVVHGDLRFVRQPLLLGHYESLRLTGAEQVMNQHLGGELEGALRTGLYPSAPGTWHVFLNQRLDPENPWRGPRPEAAIVAGLGPEGGLSRATLVQAVMTSTLAWVTHRRERDTASTTFELAATLLGSGGQGIDVATAASAVVEGVLEANAKLSEQKWATIRRLHLVELHLDRASEACSALQALAQKNGLIVEPVVQAGLGGLRRPLERNYRGTDYDLLIVRAEPKNHELNIEYTLATRRARADLSARQVVRRQLLRPLIGDRSAQPLDELIGRRLFHLLIPARLKPFLAHAPGMLLDVDPVSCNVPWELLTGDSPDGLPLSIRTRLIRRFRATSREQVRASLSTNVLIVADPQTSDRFPALPMARQEAAEVASVITTAGERAVEVRQLVKADARVVVDEVLAQDWRVLHLVGHSRYDPTLGGGLVLSEGASLGASEIRLMRVVPELVFANCSFAPVAASSFVEQLTRAGVRCMVVAAGVIKDDAARVFATTFYSSLLRGRRFMDAVADARQAAYQLGDTTWAAFQCYGDPDWVFDPGAARPEVSRIDDFMPQIASADDLLVAIETLTIDARFGRRSRESLHASLMLIEDRHPHFVAGGKVAEALGRGWAEAGDFARAVAWFENARSAADQQATIRAAAELANLQVRLASTVVVDGHREASGAALDRARSTMLEAIGTLEGLIPTIPTVEHYSLCGSALWRLALIEAAAGNEEAERVALERMREHYFKAEELARAAHLPEAFYPAIRRMAAEIGAFAGRSDWRGLDAASISSARKSVEHLVTTDPDFWSVFASIELNLYEAMSQQHLARRRGALERELRDLYRRVTSVRLWQGAHQSAAWVLAKYAARATTHERAAADRLSNVLSAFSRGDGASAEPRDVDEAEGV